MPRYPQRLPGFLIITESPFGKLWSYLTARDLAENEATSGLVIDRLAIPARVRSVATVLLAVFAVLFAIAALLVVTGITAVFVLPLTKGRAGVGTAMITLFFTSITAAMSAVLLRSARRAARVTKGDVASVGSLSAIAIAFAMLSAVSTLFTWWVFAAFFQHPDSGAPVQPLLGALLVAGPASALVVFALCAVGLRGKRGDL